MATYTLISSNVLASSAASVTFSSIPATYTDLVLRISARSDNTGYTYPSYLRFTFNSNTSSVYSFTQLYAQDAVAASNRGSNQTGNQGYGTPSNAGTSNTFSSVEIYIPSYTASQSKPLSSFGVTENNSTNFATIGAAANLFRDNTAVSSIQITDNSSFNFLSTSSFYLYGISNA
jgi:hypothetical protein